MELTTGMEYRADRMSKFQLRSEATQVPQGGSNKGSRMAVGDICEQIGALENVLRPVGGTTGKTTGRTSGMVHQLMKPRLRTMSRTLAQNHLPAGTK
jgi:hypothetical protein